MKIKMPLFEKTNKKNEKLPDWGFSIKDGDKWINPVSGYNMTSKAGKKYISLSIDIEELQKYIKIAPAQNRKFN